MLNRSPVNVVSPASVEDLENRRLMTASYDIGINLNDSGSATVTPAIPILKSLGVKTLRLWSSVTDFNSRSMTNSMQRAIEYSAAGFDITLEIANKGGFVPDAADVKGYFEWAVSNPSLKAAVDRWEIGNEPDHDEYWQGSLPQYVNNFLKPAYEALNPAGEDVVSAGPSWNVQDVATMIKAGMLNYTDYVGFHPYATGVSGVKASVAGINNLVAGRKPIAFTEWNVRGLETNKAAWGAAVAEAFPAVKAGSDLNYYFALKVQNSLAGPGGILTTSMAYNQPFYNAFATFANAGGSTSTPPGNGGSMPSGSAGKISGTLFNDDDADGVFDGNENTTGSRTVYIDANGNGQLDAGERTTTSDGSGNYTFTNLAKGTYNISRVFPAGYKLSNNDLGYVSVSLATSQSLSGVDLGTKLAAGTSTGGGSGSSDGPTVTSLQLINADTGKTISGYSKITASTTINMDLLPDAELALVAIGNSKVSSIKLTGIGSSVVENVLPYALFRDNNNGGFYGWDPVAGKYVISATAYSLDNAAGTKGNTLSVTLTFA